MVSEQSPLTLCHLNQFVDDDDDDDDNVMNLACVAHNALYCHLSMSPSLISMLLYFQSTAISITTCRSEGCFRMPRS